MSHNKPSLYLVSVLLFMLILPAGCIAFEYLSHRSPLGWILIGRWFVFWCVGVRLLIAGLRQVTKPSFTAQEIFHFTGEESYPVIRELGFGNISIGLLGILTMIRPEWCLPAAVTGGLYYGLVGTMHVWKKPAGTNELIALVSDLYLSGIMLLYLLYTLILV